MNISDLPLILQMPIFLAAGTFLGCFFAFIPFFCTGLQDTEAHQTGLEEYIGYGISVLLFLGGYVAAGFIIWG